MRMAVILLPTWLLVGLAAVLERRSFFFTVRVSVSVAVYGVRHYTQADENQDIAAERRPVLRRHCRSHVMSVLFTIRRRCINTHDSIYNLIKDHFLFLSIRNSMLLLIIPPFWCSKIN